MTVYQQLEAIREQIITVCGQPLQLTKGNCFVSITSMPVRGMGQRDVQVYAAGGSYTDAGGGLLRRDYTLGVAVRSVLVVDQLDRFIETSRDLIVSSRRIRNAVHLFYNDLFPEPPTVSSDSAPRREPGNKGEAVIEISFRACCIERFSEIKA